MFEKKSSRASAATKRNAFFFRLFFRCRILSFFIPRA